MRIEQFYLTISTTFIPAGVVASLAISEPTSCVEAIMDNNPRLSANNLGLLRKKAGFSLTKIFLKKVAEMFGGFGYFL